MMLDYILEDSNKKNPSKRVELLERRERLNERTNKQIDEKTSVDRISHNDLARKIMLMQCQLA